MMGSCTAVLVTLTSLVWLAPPASAPHEAACGAGLPDTALAPIPNKPGASRGFDPQLGFMSRASGPLAFGEGALAGKAVYVSAGHGLYWTGSSWNTQRNSYDGIIEDMVAIETVNQYLIPYLHAMGAYVVAVREPGMNRNMVIVDDADAMLEGSPVEIETNAPGWGEVALPIVSDDVRPFQTGGTSALLAQRQRKGGLVYAPEIPQDGYYNVYVSFAAGEDRASDAHYVVRHGGGQTHFRLDQAHHGSTWVLLGEFYFQAGHDPSSAAVVVLDDSADAGAVISTDAVRFGGGMGVHDRGGGVSGRPMHEHGPRYYTQFAGAPYDVFGDNATENLDNYTARPAFAKWEHPQEEDAVYVAWHTNAFDQTGQGTSSYTYGPGGTGISGSTAGFSGVPGSRELQDAVHAQLIGDLRAAWDPQWRDDGRYSADLAEVNPSETHNDEFPAALFEVAYHDTPSQIEQLRDPRFRRIAARAIAQGIAEYFANKDGVPLVLPPEPPEALWIHNDGDGNLEVGWRPVQQGPAEGDPADAYVVQVSTNGYGFDDGTIVKGTSHTLDGLEPGDVRYVRVLGKNAGGHSLPSHTVAASVAPSGAASVLVVGGFDRIDGGLLVPDDASSFGQGMLDRMWLHRINDGTYAVRHANAIAAAGFSFDGATDDAVEQGDVIVDGYQAIDWFTGEDSTNNDPLSAPARESLADYLDDGGRMLLSGAELGWALDLYGEPEEQAFFYERLHARYALDDAETYEVVAGGEPLDQVMPMSFSDPTSYDPRYPDVLEPDTGGVVALHYQGGAGMQAAIAWGVDDAGDRGVLLGFPFETIATEAARNDLMARVLAFFEVEEAPGDDDSGTTGSGSTGSGDDTGGDSGDDDGSATGTTELTWGTGGTGATDSSPQGGEAVGDGCGCAQGRQRGSGALLGLLLVALVRRRRAPPQPGWEREKGVSARASTSEAAWDALQPAASPHCASAAASSPAS